MNVHSFSIISTLFYLISVADFTYSQCIPVYMWGNFHYNKPSSPLQVVDQEYLLNFLDNHIDKNNPVVVFAEQSLSPEDFLLRNEKDESVFSRLPTSQKSTVTYWPCVMSPVDTFDKLNDRNIIKSSLSDFSTKSINLKPKDVLIIDLNDANEDEGRINLLERHDESIGKIQEHFEKEYEDVTMLFTGRQPSWITVDEVRSHRRIRDTSKAEGGATGNETVNYVVYSNEDVIISAIDNPTITNNGSITLLKDATITTENKTEEGLTIDFTVKDVVTIKWIFQIGGGYWILQSITVFNHTASAEDAEYYFRVKEIYAPYRFSYHCANKVFEYPKNPNQNMTFESLQLQVFFAESKQEGKFGDSFDCTGFMSAPIWSGLFVTFILVLIMTCGLTMMMDIKTMDRFDDPKGKTITINASE